MSLFADRTLSGAPPEVHTDPPARQGLLAVGGILGALAFHYVAPWLLDV